MNYLRLLSYARENYRKYTAPEYWLDRLVEKRGVNVVNVRGRILAVLYNPEADLQVVVPGANIVTTAGDIYYAQMSAGESPTNDFDGASSGLRLGSDNTAPSKSDDDVITFLSGTAHALDAGYPQTDDADGDNTGAAANVVSWRYSYLTSEGNAAGIEEGAIVDNRTTPTAALSRFLFAAPFTKTSSDTLKVFVNHEFEGV